MNQTTTKLVTTPVAPKSAWDAAITGAYMASRDGMMAAATTICGRENAADIAQDVFLRVWSHPDAFDAERGTLTHYLYVVTRGMSIDRLRSIASQRARDNKVFAGSDTETSADLGREMFGRELQDDVRRAIATLRANERDVIYAAYFGHLTYQEVADCLGIPEGTVKSRIRLGLSKLRVELGPARRDHGWRFMDQESLRTVTMNSAKR